MVLTAGPLEIDESRQAASVRGRDVRLRPLDLRLLALLARTSDRAVTRRELADALWGPDSPVDVRSIDACIARIRRALGSTDALVTVRRVGYRLDPERLV
jgi:DNA-binding response OmpR family regulator